MHLDNYLGDRFIMAKQILPESVKKKLLERGARGARRVVVVYNKQGTPSSVWGFDEYLQRQELTKMVKPWKNRLNSEVLDPLGAVEGAPVGPLTRDQIYED